MLKHGGRAPCAQSPKWSETFADAPGRIRSSRSWTAASVPFGGEGSGGVPFGGEGSGGVPFGGEGSGGGVELGDSPAGMAKSKSSIDDDRGDLVFGCDGSHQNPPRCEYTAAWWAPRASVSATLPLLKKSECSWRSADEPGSTQPWASCRCRLLRFRHRVVVSRSFCRYWRAACLWPS
jgi:hypothetical protein